MLDAVGDAAVAGLDIDGDEPPLISVIIPTYDRPDTLVEAVRSVFEQGGVAVEVIVIDDSPRRTAAAAMAALDDPRVRYIANPAPSRGRPALVRNMGIALAQGQILHFLDDDDLVPPGYYADACAVLEARPEVGVLFGTVEPFGDAGQIGEERDYFARARARALRCGRWGGRWVFTAAMLFGPTLLVCSAGLVRRELMAAVGGFNPAMKLMEDVDFHMRSMREGGVCFLDRPSLRYRIGPSLMRAKDQERARVIAESYQVSQGAYRQRRGVVEFVLLKLLAKGLRLA